MEAVIEKSHNQAVIATLNEVLTELYQNTGSRKYIGKYGSVFMNNLFMDAQPTDKITTGKSDKPVIYHLFIEDDFVDIGFVQAENENGEKETKDFCRISSEDNPEQVLAVIKF